MAVCLVNLTEKQKACLGITLVIFCTFEIFIGLLICSLMIYFHFHLQWQVLLVQGYNSENLYLSILSIGIIIIILHLIGSKICYDCGQLDTRSRFGSMLFIWVSLICLLAIVELALCISCFAHTLKVYNEFQDGLYKTLDLYMKDFDIKQKLDKLQLEYQCCGSEHFHDWMLTDWTPEIYNPFVEKSSLRETYKAFYKDIPEELSLEPHHILVVPFSCCRIDIKEPCFHDYITQVVLMDNESPIITYARENWWTDSHGLNDNGCAQIIMDNYNQYLTTLGYVFLTAFGIEVILLILVRYLETSISNMDLLGDPDTGISPGWLCEGCDVL